MRSRPARAVVGKAVALSATFATAGSAASASPSPLSCTGAVGVVALYDVAGSCSRYAVPVPMTARSLYDTLLPASATPAQRLVDGETAPRVTGAVYVPLGAGSSLLFAPRAHVEEALPPVLALPLPPPLPPTVPPATSGPAPALGPATPLPPSSPQPGAPQPDVPQPVPTAAPFRVSLASTTVVERTPVTVHISGYRDPMGLRRGVVDVTRTFTYTAEVPTRVPYTVTVRMRVKGKLVTRKVTRYRTELRSRTFTNTSFIGNPSVGPDGTLVYSNSTVCPRSGKAVIHVAARGEAVRHLTLTCTEAPVRR